MKFSTATLSARGNRPDNQDCCGFEPCGDAVCWVLADGLGGHGGGETAARIAVESIIAWFGADRSVTAGAVAAHLSQANQAIVEAQNNDQRLASMRTTAVVLISDGRQAIWGHVGDSRLYHFRTGRVHSQTKDHSVPQAMSAAGEITPAQIRFHEDRNRLLRSLGHAGELRPSVLPEPVEIEPGDAFLLCSDGFWEPVTEAEMETDLARGATPEEWLSAMEARIRGRAEDNYSALAIYAPSKEPKAI